jgi:signal transduction histidine kinase
MDSRRQWLTVMKQIQSGEMPPEKAKQPKPAEVEPVTAWIQSELSRAASVLKGTGGEVVLRTMAAEQSGQVGAMLSVSDDGPGMPAEDRSHAGERFFRADKARATPGSGLGLSLVQAMAHLHGGELVLADAEPGLDPPGLAAVLRLPRP